MLGVVGGEVGEEGGQEVVLEDLVVEGRGEAGEGLGAARPGVQGGDRRARAAYRRRLVVAHLVDVLDVRADLREEVREQLRLSEPLQVVLGRRPDDAQDVVPEVLLAARQFVVDALGCRRQLDGGPCVGGQELRRAVFRDAVADVLDGLSGHAPTETRTARRKLYFRRAVRSWPTSADYGTHLP